MLYMCLPATISVLQTAFQIFELSLINFVLIQNLENSEKNRRKQEVLGIFFFERGGVTYLQK